jgi:hypothetical protein
MGVIITDTDAHWRSIPVERRALYIASRYAAGSEAGPEKS